MRKFVFRLLLSGGYNLKEPELDGSYTLVAAKYGDSVLSKEDIEKHKNIKIIKNGYWITATSFGNKQRTFEDGSGGTYTKKRR